MTTQHVPADLMAAYASLPESGRVYLLGWLMGAIRSEGAATPATVAAALPQAQRWAEKWPMS